MSYRIWTAESLRPHLAHFLGNLPGTCPGEEDCWAWYGPTDRDGYGLFRAGSRISMLAHRAAWVYAKGELDPHATIRQTCGNRRCCRVEHLEIGARVDNFAVRVPA